MKTYGGNDTMKSFRLINRNNRFLFRFVTSYSVILILILFMGLFFLYSALTGSREYAYRQNYSLLQNNVAEFDNSLQLFSTLTTQVSSNTDFRSLLYSKELSPKYYQLANSSMSYLTSIMSLQSVLPINSFYIYLPETDYLISSSSFISSDLYYHYDKSYPSANYAAWHDMLASYENMKTLLPLSAYADRSTSYVYKLQLPNFHSQTMKPAIACFEINLSKLRHLFLNVLDTPSSMLCITAPDGTELLTISDSLELSTPIESIASRITEASVYSTELFQNKNEEYCITRVVSSFNNWNYYLIQPSSDLLNELSAYQKTYGLIIFAVCVLTFLLIYSLSKANVKPLLAMNDELTTSRQENVNLQDTLDRQRPLVYSAYVARIMKGTIGNEQDIEEICDFLHLEGLGLRHYFVLCISVYLEQLEFYREDVDAPTMSLHSRLNEYEDMLYQSFYHFFGDDILIYHPDVNSFALLLSSDPEVDENEFNRYTADTFLELHTYLLKEHSLWIFGGLGGGNTKLPYFWKSYQQATEAASYLQEGNIFQVYTDIRRSNETYYYPFEMAQQLTNFIHMGNEAQILEIFKLIRRENFEFRSLPITTIKWLLSDIRNTLVKIRYSISETASNKETLELVDTGLKQTKTLELMERLSLSLASLFEQKQEGNKLIAAIQQYISKNYADSSLSLKKISDEFTISESYFSYLFKAETGKNFSEYLEEIRMAEAMHLVKETDTPLSELYLSLGYNNPNSFRRAFKKVHGVSPKTIRDSSGISHET
ncbi:MAG: helix-turn-helix domain-containing protein [Lachnospiraceae bacterium]